MRASKAHSHRKKGWEEFTNHVISTLNDQKTHLVFFLWGKHAQRIGEWFCSAGFLVMFVICAILGAELDREKHLVLECPHPSGLSAHKGFFGCKHFSKCNAYLETHGFEPIDWTTSAADSVLS